MADRKPTLKEMLAYEKSVLNPIRYNMNYRIVPAYAGLMAILLIVFGVLMSIDDVKYLPHAIVMLVLFVIASVALVVYGKKVAKEEILTEIKRYDLDYTQVPAQEEYDYSDENHKILFTKNGMYIDDDFYWYNHLRTRIVTKTHLHRVMIHVGFLTAQNGFCRIPFGARSIKMLRQFDIKLENPEVLEMLIHDTYAAFERIYKTGKI